MRRVRWLDVLLIAAIVPLGVWAGRTARERSRLEATHARLRDRLGFLNIADRTKFAFRAIPTGSPTEFAWRAYQPAGSWAHQSMSIESGIGGGPSSRPTASSEGIWRIRFRDRPDGNIEVSILTPDGGSYHLIQDRGLCDLLRGRWDQVEVEQVGRDGLVALDPDRPVVLLRLSLSPALMAEAQSRGSPANRLLPPPEFYRYTLNPQAKP